MAMGVAVLRSYVDGYLVASTKCRILIVPLWRGLGIVVLSGVSTVLVLGNEYSR